MALLHHEPSCREQQHFRGCGQRVRDVRDMSTPVFVKDDIFTWRPAALLNTKFTGSNIFDNSLSESKDDEKEERKGKKSTSNGPQLFQPREKG